MNNLYTIQKVIKVNGTSDYLNSGNTQIHKDAGGKELKLPETRLREYLCLLEQYKSIGPKTPEGAKLQKSLASLQNYLARQLASLKIFKRYMNSN